MITETQDKDTEIRPEVLARLAPSAAKSKAGPPTKAEMEKVRRYNLALYRLSHGKGSIAEELAIVTGLSTWAIERRCFRAEKHFGERELNAESGLVSARDREYLEKRYGNMNDPAVKAFVQRMRRNGNS